MKSIDLTGQRFGRLIALKFTGCKKVSGISRRHWLCRCDCGTEKEFYVSAIRNGKTGSCGCAPRGPGFTHGMTNSSEYRTWAAMKQRCENIKDARFLDYGGRGISVCKRWHSFESFMEDMGRKPSPDHSIDRIDNNGNYEPGNCRWATRSQQQGNKRRMFIPDPPKGDDHWTRKEPQRALCVARANIRKTHHAGELNNNAKINFETAQEIRRFAGDNPNLRMDQIGERFGIKREQTRKIVKGIAWLK